MEKKEERVLAYSLSKIINHDDLQSVSGGMHTCHHQTFGGSAGSGQPTEVHIDVVIDF